MFYHRLISCRFPILTVSVCVFSYRHRLNDGNWWRQGIDKHFCSPFLSSPKKSTGKANVIHQTIENSNKIFKPEVSTEHAHEERPQHSDLEARHNKAPQSRCPLRSCSEPEKQKLYGNWCVGTCDGKPCAAFEKDFSFFCCVTHAIDDQPAVECRSRYDKIISQITNSFRFFAVRRFWC